MSIKKTGASMLQFKLLQLSKSCTKTYQAAHNFKPTESFNALMLVQRFERRLL